ncbi:MAG: acetylxylan esterase [Fuerstiella sp.]|nr:acetylxylan esterase [Fuerstiella sp.]
MQIKGVFCLSLSVMATLLPTCDGSEKEFNYDESLVPRYELPNPLMTEDGRVVNSVEIWRSVRRPEILRLFEQHVFGRLPGINVRLRVRTHECTEVFDHLAIREQQTVYLTDDDTGPSVDVLIYTPKKSVGPVPAFMGLNFGGNHTIDADPAIRLSKSLERKDQRRKTNGNRALEASRGLRSARWDIRKILSGGYGLVTAYYGDIDPDFDDGFQNGIHQLDPEKGPVRAGDAGGSISAWAWGLSRILDTLETHPLIDGRRVAVFGHSRLGKTSLWAGATDERFRLVISNNSGCGGAALSRRRYGETVKRINTVFPHWFCRKHREYNDKENSLPVDHHQLLALMAPRAVYVASAQDDRWADPHGEMLSLYYAGPVFALFGKSGLPSADQIEIDRPLQVDVGYHERTGKHDVTSYDWTQYLKFADRHLK